MAYENFLKRKGRNSGGRSGPLPTFEYAGMVGVNYADSIYAMPANHSPFGQDTDFGNPIGSIKKAPGYESLITSLGAGKMQGLHGWPHSTGDQMLAAWDKNLYLLTGNSGSVAKSSQADWQAGTLDDVDAAASAGDIVLAKGTDFSETDTATADFDGTHSQTQAINDSVQLAASVAGTGNGITTLGATTKGALASYDQEAGWEFAVGATGFTVDKLRIYSGLTGDITVRLWRVSDQAKLGEVVISATDGAWAEGVLSTPIALAANTSYVVTFGYVYGGGNNGRYNTSTVNTFNSAITFTQGRLITGSINVFPTTTVGTFISGIVDFVSSSTYETSGVYTHTEQDVSTVGTANAATITFNKTTPADTTLTVETRYSLDGGGTWSTWTERASGDTIIPAGTDISNGKVQWRTNLATTDTSVTPSLDDVTVAVTAGYYTTGNWISPVYTLTNTPTVNVLTYTITTPVNTTVTVYARGSSNGTIFGDWQEVINSGDAIPLQKYMQIKFVLATTDLTATPTASGFLISYSSSYTTANKLDIGPLGRTSGLLTGNRVRFCNYEDWLLMADGLRPFMAYITDATQETDTAQAGGASTITLKAGASAVNNFYTNAFITITGGTGEGQVRWISGYVGATKIATVSVAWTTQPDATSTYSIGSAVKVRQLGVNPPTVAPSGADSGVAGSPNGAYLLKVTYVNADGVESNPGDASASVSVTSKKITWTIPADASAGNTTAKRRLYRTASGGSVYKYLAEVADNTTTTYTDDTADVALGSLMLDNNNIPPAACTLVYQFTSYVFYVDNYDVWFSKAGSPDQVPNISGDIQQMPFPGRVLDIQSNPIALMISGEDFDSSITSNTGFIFDSDPTVDTTTTKTIEKNGALSAEASAMCLSPSLGSTLIRNTNTGIRSTRPGLQDNSIESVPLSRNIQAYYERSINRDQAAGVYFNSYYIYSMEHQPADGSASEHLTFAYDLRTEQWYGPWNFGMSCYTISNNVLYAGDTENGKIYRMFTGNSYAGANIHMIADLPMRAPAGEAGSCKFIDILLIVSADSDTTNTNVKVKVDEREATIAIGSLTPTFTGDTRLGHNFIRTKKYRIPLPPGHTYSARAEDDSINPLEILKFVTEYEVLALSR